MTYTARRMAPGGAPIRRGSLAAISTLALVGTLGACGSAADDAASGPSDSSGAYVAKAKKDIEAASAEVTDYPTPGPAINTSSLRGKTFYYVPITIQASSFKITAEAMKKAVAPLGIRIQVCDGGASPDKAAACVNEATKVRAAGIISDALPYALAANAFDAAKKNGIPILISNQPAPAGYKNDDQLSYYLGNPIKMMQIAAEWIVADSGGKAKVVVNEYTDSPDTKRYMEDYGLKILRKDCPDCTTAVNEVSSANFSMIPSSTSSILLKNPDANYFFNQYDTSIQPAMAGIQQANAKQRLKGVSTNGLLGSLQLLKRKNFLYADVASHYNYAAYSLIDFAMRMALKSELPTDLTVPVRLITSDNVGTLGLTAGAEASGEWFGPTTYKKMFAGLWAGK